MSVSQAQAIPGSTPFFVPADLPSAPAPVHADPGHHHHSSSGERAALRSAMKPRLAPIQHARVHTAPTGPGFERQPLPALNRAVSFALAQEGNSHSVFEQGGASGFVPTGLPTIPAEADSGSIPSGASSHSSPDEGAEDNGDRPFRSLTISIAPGDGLPPLPLPTPAHTARQNAQVEDPQPAKKPKKPKKSFVALPASWAGSKDYITLIAEGLEAQEHLPDSETPCCILNCSKTCNVVGNIAGPAFRFIGETAKLPVKAAGGCLALTTTVACGLAGVFVAIPGCCSTKCLNVSKGLFRSAGYQGGVFLLSTGTLIATPARPVLFLASKYCPDAIRNIELRVFDSVEGCFDVTPPLSMEGLSPDEEFAWDFKKSAIPRMIGSMCDAPTVHVEKVQAQHVRARSISARFKAAKKAKQCFRKGCCGRVCASTTKISGRLLGLVPKAAGLGLAIPTATVSTVGYLAAKLVGCCSKTFDDIAANALGKFAKENWKIAWYTLGKMIPGTVLNTVEDVSNCCCPEATQACCIQKVDKCIYRCVASCCLDTTHTDANSRGNRPLTVGQKLYEDLHSSGLATLVRTLADTETISHSVKKAATRGQSMGGGFLVEDESPSPPSAPHGNKVAPEALAPALPPAPVRVTPYQILSRVQYVAPVPAPILAPAPATPSAAIPASPPAPVRVTPYQILSRVQQVVPAPASAPAPALAPASVLAPYPGPTPAPVTALVSASASAATPASLAPDRHYRITGQVRQQPAPAPDRHYRLTGTVKQPDPSQNGKAT